MGQRPQFAEWLRGLRDAKRLPLRVIAAKVRLDSTLLSKLERGDRLPTDLQARALAGCYRIPQNEMRSRLIAARIVRDHGSDPTLPAAISLVREQAESLERKYSRKRVIYSARRRNV